jgi:hypothetical protein
MLVLMVLQLETLDSPGGGIYAAAACVWGLGGLVGWLLYARHVGRAWSQENVEAVRWIGEGEPGKAAAILDRLLAKSRAFPVAYSLFLLNRGIAATRMGELTEARAMLGAVQGTNWLERRKFRHLVPTVMISLGKVEALAGKLDDAESWQRRARARLTSASAPISLTLDVLIAARRGRWSEAEALCEATWKAAEASLSAREMKLLRVLRGFIASVRAPGDATTLGMWLAGAKPVPFGMFAYVGAAWPEFAAFEQAELAPPM